MDPANFMIVVGDSPYWHFFCAVCRSSFQADHEQVVCCDGKPICLECVDRANPIRQERGLPPIAVNRAAYDARE